MPDLRPSRFATASKGKWRAFPLVVTVALLVAMITAGVPGKDLPPVKLPRLPGAATQNAIHVQHKRMEEIRRRFEQGVAMLQMGEYEHAVTAFHRVLSLEPKLPEAHINIGFALYELRDYLAAQRFFEGALALAPSLNNARYGLAISMLQQGDSAAARTALLAFLERAESDDPFRAKALAKLREVERALPANPGPAAASNGSTPPPSAGRKAR